MSESTLSKYPTTGTYRTILQVVQNCNSFEYDPINDPECQKLYKFYIPDNPTSDPTSNNSEKTKEIMVGLLDPESIPALESFNNNKNTDDEPPVFVIDHTDRTLKFAPHYASTQQSRSQIMSQVLTTLKSQNAWPILAKWRNEKYPVYGKTGNLLLSMERAASYTFGIRTYGVHINGYTKTASPSSSSSSSSSGEEIKMWVARRSLTKQTWPGFLDQIVAGGIATGYSMIDTVVKECEEEAGLSPELAKNAVAAGTIQYFTRSQYGLQPETQYVYDLEIPENIVPKPNDGEVGAFYLWSLDEIKSRLLAGEFKPNCAVCVIDFMIRHGHINGDNDPEYLKIIDNIHVPLPMPGPSI
ncbi:hypothetical protein H4219_004552 [Mycoemilia scoparia]|uniref:Nudix hydrolase domain-containing protein n=1 Tax=Mycoemilia scoparia TaxID=417184 RepID=A0A9W7ZRA6_9FUNG|nr:hypothetical protein H4219_004552 [Mycoemilia scoparia]